MKCASKGRDKWYKQRIKRETSPAFKRCHLELKDKRYNTEQQKQLREEVTYQPSIGLETVEESDVISVPECMLFQAADPITNSDEAMICIFDLETSSSYHDCEICQLSVVTFDGTKEFNQYIVPRGNQPQNSQDYTNNKVKWQIV